MKRALKVVAALIQQKGTFLLCQRNEGDKYGLLWEFPGGCVEEKEPLTQAIEREIKEEVDLEVHAQDMVGVFDDEDAHLIITVHLFKCDVRAGVLVPKDCKDCGFFTSEQITRLGLAPVDKKIWAFIQAHFT